MPEEFNVTPVLPEEAAEDLAKIAEDNDFTLFEYFLTDRAGHKQDLNLLSTVLYEFSAFFMKLVECASNNLRIILISDHGNCEEPETKLHSENPVPFFLYGENLKAAGTVNSILDIYHYITEEKI
jgi:2,3-bisphosphoglycerate-independent phosphoglycerate mutase